MFKKLSLLLFASARESELFLMKEALDEYEASAVEKFGSLATNLSPIMPQGSKWEEISVLNGCIAEANY